MDINTNGETKLGTEHILDVSDRLYKIVLGCLALLGVVAAGWGLYAFQALPHNMPREIMVSGEGKAYAKPDVAMVSFGAHTEAVKSQDAVAQNNEIMNKVIAAVKKLGVADKDIQTTMYNLQPLYDYGYPVPMVESVRDSTGASVAYPVPVKGRTFRGYSVDQQLQVKIHTFENINAIMDAATSNGANTVGSLQFTVDDMEEVKSQAREKAVIQAKKKAAGLFSAAGLRGAKIVNISEGYGNYPPPFYSTMAKDMVGGAASAPIPEIQPGQQEVDVTVTLTYRVR